VKTNLRAIVATVVALIILIVKYFVPTLSEQLDLLESPLADIIYGLLLLYAGIETYVVSGKKDDQK
jgi:putative effector of murein hydrolase LrgA (UPF0299 family)